MFSRLWFFPLYLTTFDNFLIIFPILFNTFRICHKVSTISERGGGGIFNFIFKKPRIFHKNLTTSRGEGEVCISISLIGKKSLHLGENYFPIFSFWDIVDFVFKILRKFTKINDNNGNFFCYKICAIFSNRLCPNQGYADPPPLRNGKIFMRDVECAE